MNIHDAIELVLKGEGLVIGDKTIEVDTVETIRLETGEMTYYIEDETQGLVLSLDAGAEEILLMQKIDDADGLDATLDLQVYAGDDYEFSVEGEGVIVDEDDVELEKVMFRDFEDSSGRKMRIVEYVGSGEVAFLLGNVIGEEELQTLA